MAAIRFCAVCKAVIDPERLEGVPDTRLCTTHAREIEKYGGEFRLLSTPDRTSKQGSLKHNYSGVTASRSRNAEALQRLQQDYENRRE